MNTIKVTVKQFSEISGLNGPQANSMINILMEQGHAEVVGEVRTRKQGRAAKIYKIPQEVTLKLFDDVVIPSETTIITSSTETESKPELEPVS